MGCSVRSAASHPSRAAFPPAAARGQVSSSARTRARLHRPLSQLRPCPGTVPGLSVKTRVTHCKFNFTSCPGSQLLALRARPWLSSGWSAASPEPTAQSPAPPREPPPGRPGQRVPATVARRPLVLSGSQGEAPTVAWEAPGWALWALCVTVEGQRHPYTWACYTHIQGTQVRTHEFTSSPELTFTTHTHLRVLIQSHRHTHMVYA